MFASQLYLSVTRWVRIAPLLVVALFLTGCGYNDIQATDEGVKSAWSEVLNQYKRRADLIPNLVETVKGYAEQEKDVLTSVTEARAKATQTQVSIDPSNPAALQQFEQAQAGMSSALSRLLVTVEKYPELKSDANFRELQTQLEGTENRISVARKRYIDSIREYNTLIRRIPVNLTAMVMGYKEKPQFTVADEAQVQEAPKVDFNKPAGATN
jgi:LemA protein